MKAILGSVERDVADAFAYIPYGLAAAVVFLLIMILYNRKKYGRVSFIIKSSLLIIYVVVVGHLTLFSRESGIVDRVDLTFFSLLEESSDYAIQLIENVLLFLPAGILCPCEYSCAATPQIRQTGNRLSGLAETAYASLLAQCFV